MTAFASIILSIGWASASSKPESDFDFDAKRQYKPVVLKRKPVIEEDLGGPSEACAPASKLGAKDPLDTYLLEGLGGLKLYSQKKGSSIIESILGAGKPGSLKGDVMDFLDPESEETEPAIGYDPFFSESLALEEEHPLKKGKGKAKSHRAKSPKFLKDSLALEEPSERMPKVLLEQKEKKS